MARRSAWPGNWQAFSVFLDVEPIDGADRIEKVAILGWHCVVKKGEFQAGDPCVYFEIDSLLPDWPEFEFLRKSYWNELLGRYRLRTARLRGVVSQGLALPLAAPAPRLAPGPIDQPGSLAGLRSAGTPTGFPEGTDLTEILQVEKYEPPVPSQLEGQVRPFDWPIARTDEVRLESDPALLAAMHGKAYYISAKLDGTSGSFVLVESEGGPEFHVCSRNYSLVESEGNTFWRIARKYNLEALLRAELAESGRLLAIQGEVCGPGIQSNRLNLPEPTLFVFNIIDVRSGHRFALDEMRAFCSAKGLLLVPVIHEGYHFSLTQDDIFRMSEYLYHDVIPEVRREQEAEGIVVRSTDQSVSFKKVSNRFLLGDNP
jgi:RNA ligase (TIGR02306 family)